MNEITKYREWQSKFKFANGAVASSLMIGQPYVDRDKMSARAVISTARKDRVGDVLLPRGCQLTNYVRNPVVLYGHGLEGISLPVGTSNDRDGNLSVVITDEDVSATCYFSQSLPDAAQIFQLIDEGIIRATSVRETPLKSRRMTGNDGPYDLVELFDLEEWSWAAIGVNPDALAKCLSRNRLDGRPILPSIMKSLNAICPKPSKPGRGFSESVMKDPADNDDNGSEKLVTPKEQASASPKDENAEQTPADQTDATDSSDTPATETETMGDANEDGKLGRQGIQYAHDSMKALRGGLRGITKCLEHPGIQDHLQSLHDDLGDKMEENKKMRDEHYPTSSELKDEDMGDDGGGDDSGGDDEGGDSEMKSFLVQSFNGRNLMSAVESHLKSLAKSPRLTAAERKTLDSDLKTLNALRTQAKSHPKPKSVVKSVEKPKPKPAETVAAVPEEDPTQLAALEAQLKALKALIPTKTNA